MPGSHEIPEDAGELLEFVGPGSHGFELELRPGTYLLDVGYSAIEGMWRAAVIDVVSE